MDAPYRISGGVVPASAALASPPLLPDSKLRLSDSDIVVTSDRGSCAVDPGPVPLTIVIFSTSSIGAWLYGERKRLVLSRSLRFSTFAMLRLTVLVM